jgi:dienelactone hydrolase
MLTPIRIDNRINGFLGKPTGDGKRPAVIHLHERYGIVQHTTDLGEKFVDAGYVTVVPDLFWRFTGDREALARGDGRCDLSDEEVLADIDAVGRQREDNLIGGEEYSASQTMGLIMHSRVCLPGIRDK